MRPTRTTQLGLVFVLAGVSLLAPAQSVLPQTSPTQTPSPLAIAAKDDGDRCTTSPLSQWLSSLLAKLPRSTRGHYAKR
jgi:hypothetical protein